MNSNLKVWSFLFLAFALVPNIQAQNPTAANAYTTSLTGATQFTSLAAAEAAMRAAHVAGPNLTHTPSADTFSSNYYQRTYKLVPSWIWPQPTGWQSYEACWGDEFAAYPSSFFVCPNNLPSESAAIDAVPSQCDGLTLEPVDGEWMDLRKYTIEGSVEAVQPFDDIGFKRYRFVGDIGNGEGVCEKVGTGLGWLYMTHVWIYASRDFDCPQDFHVASQPSDYQIQCAGNLVAWINEVSPFADQPNDECLGNPCSVATGGKIQGAVDYEAPGISFVRSWRSEIAPLFAFGGGPAPCLGDPCVVTRKAVLPWGWTHSYAMAVRFQGTTLALFRPNGALITMKSVASKTYMATNGSGLQARGGSSSDVTVYLQDGSREVYTYVSCGTPVQRGHRLTQVIDVAGRVTQVQYAPGCTLAEPPIRIVGPFGHTLDIYYNQGIGSAEPFIDRLVDSANHEIRFDYATKNVQQYQDVLLDEVTYQDGSQVHYLYDDNTPANRRLLTGISDEEGVEYANFAYDTESRAVTTQRAGGFFRWDFQYNAGTTIATDGNGVATTYGFHTNIGLVRAITTAVRSGFARSNTNETSNQYRLLTKTDELGVVTQFAYNTFHITSKVEAFGASDVAPRTTTYQYLNDTSQLTTLVMREGACGQPASLQTVYLSGTQLPTYLLESGCSGARTTAIEYGAPGSFTRTYGLPTAILGPRPDVADDVSFTYYECTGGHECGQLATVTNAAGHVWTFTAYDEHGRVAEIADPNGMITTFEYDLRGRLLSREKADGITAYATTYTYYGNGLLERVTRSNGAYLAYE